MAEARSVNVEETFWFKLKSNLNSCKNFHKGKKQDHVIIYVRVAY